MLAIRPESKGRTIIRGLVLYRQAFFHVFFLAILTSIATFIPRIWTLIVGQNIFLNIPQFSPYRLWLLLINLSSLVFFTALLWRIRCVVTNTHESINDDMKIALKKLIYIFVATLLQTLFIVAVSTFLLFIIFHILSYKRAIITEDLFFQMLMLCLFLAQFIIIGFLFLAFYFYLPLILIENQGIIKSLLKSASLVWGNWWRTFWVQVTPWLVYFLVIILIRYATKLPLYIYFFPLEREPTLLATCVHVLLFAIFLPWFASNMLVQLRELELRKSHVS